MDNVPRIIAYTGDTTVFPVEITEEGIPVNLVGHVLSWIISSTRDTGNLVQIDVSSHDDPTNGISSLTITPTNIVSCGGSGKYWLTGIDVVTATSTEITRVVVQFDIIDRVARI